MTIRIQYFPGDENQQNASGEQAGKANEENVAISLPRIDRPEGPFEHSGEVAGWTAEEARESEEKHHQNSTDSQG